MGSKEAKQCLGILFVPEPGRKHSYLAWNRIDEPMRSKIIELKKTGWREQIIRFTLIQAWENERRTVLIPLRALIKVSKFMETGDFRVKQDGTMFCLETPRGEENITLSTSISDLF